MMSLSQNQKKQLMMLAKGAIEEKLFGKKTGAVQVSERLKEKGGAFVTIKKGAELRGCIGYIKGYLPLDETIRKMAVQAAFHDPRFDPIGKDEWKDAQVEISVLTPMKKIDDIEEIQVGDHGLYIEKGHYSGLLLPQVATERGWDRMTFLEHTCVKAGLPKDGWKADDARIYIFSAEVF